MIKVTMNCCEWSALVDMANMLVSHPREMINFFEVRSEANLFGSAIGRIDVTPVPPTCPASMSVLFEEPELDLLARLVEWFDALLIEHSEFVMEKKHEGFKKHWSRVATIKHSFHHAKHSDTEAKNDVGDGTNNGGASGEAAL